MGPEVLWLLFGLFFGFIGGFLFAYRKTIGRLVSLASAAQSVSESSGGAGGQQDMVAMLSKFASSPVGQQLLSSALNPPAGDKPAARVDDSPPPLVAVVESESDSDDPMKKPLKKVDRGARRAKKPAAATLPGGADLGQTIQNILGNPNIQQLLGQLGGSKTAPPEVPAHSADAE